MKASIKKNNNSNSRQKDIKKTTNAVFEQYKKSFKDLALYDKGEKIGAQ
jgi:ribosomal protein S17E